MSGDALRPNPSIEATSSGKLRLPTAAPNVELQGLLQGLPSVSSE